MPYLQVLIDDGYLTRSVTIASLARIGGYPGYMANIGSDPSLVRSILFEDNDRIYLTDDKAWVLTSANIGGKKQLVFSANPKVNPLTLTDMSKLHTVSYREWSSLWANMKTDEPMRGGLKWPSNTWEESWQIILQRQYLIAFKDISSINWMTTVDSFGGHTFVSGAVAWRNTNELEPAEFHLVQKSSGNIPTIQWGLRYPGMATPDANEVINLAQNQKNLYVKGWEYGESDRWLFTNKPERILYFDVKGSETSSGTYTYTFSHLGRHLAKGGYWQVRPWPAYGVEGGVEFYNGTPNNPTVDIIVSANVIDPSLSDEDRYILGQDIYVNLFMGPNIPYPMWKPELVGSNLPKGGGICNGTSWDGVRSSCVRDYIPYDTLVGEQQCTTVDDFSNDIHCQQWALQRKGPALDTLLSNLCSSPIPSTGVTGDKSSPILAYQDPKYANVCACYMPANVYYEAIRNRYTSPSALGAEKGILVADAARVTNLNQCMSGLCTGQEGTFSPSVFYSGTRKCDVCIQASILSIENSKVGGPINIEQVCTQVDVTYTWKDLITRLEGLGVARMTPKGISGVYSHIVINEPGTAIKLITSTPLGKSILNRFTLLSQLPKDKEGNITLTQEKWGTNNTRYTNEVLRFFLQGRGT